MQAPAVPENSRTAETIHPNRPSSQKLCQCFAHAGLPALMTMALLHGSPAKKDIAGLRQIRDHLLQVDVEAKLQADGLSALAETLKILSGHEDRAMLEPFQALRG